MIRAFQVEMQKLFRSWLLYACIALMAGFAILMLLGYDALFSRMVGRQTSLHTGYMYSYIALSVAFYPLFTFIAIALAGSSISQEVRQGTLRYSLICPVSRLGFVTAKFTSLIVSITLVLVTYWVVVLGVGLVVYGPGRIATVSTVPAAEGQQARAAAILTEDEALRRSIIFVPLAVVAALTTASLAFFVSTLSSNPVIAVTIPMGLFLMSWILQFSELLRGLTIKRILFTREMYFWDKVFGALPDWDGILVGLRFNLVWTAVFLLAAVVSFCTRDVKS